MEHLLPVKKSSQECCMCGDHGFSDELFQCKICHFRSQHRYCSNLYPKAEANRVCNWCLSKRKKTEETLVSPSSKKRCVKDEEEEEEGEMKKMMKRELVDDDDDRGRVDACKSMSRAPQSQRLVERTKTKTRRRIITKGELEEKVKVRRSKSSQQEMMMVIKVKNKVRRYKLLDEVAT